jgi:hypothetical protein
MAWYVSANAFDAVDVCETSLTLQAILIPKFKDNFDNTRTRIFISELNPVNLLSSLSRKSISLRLVKLSLACIVVT